MGEVGDHIGETYKGLPEMPEGQIKFHESFLDPNEEDRLNDVMKGKSHLQYYDRAHNLISKSESGKLYTLMMAGPNSCSSCSARFTNNYCLYEHYRLTGHGNSAALQFGILNMRDLDELERK